MRQAKYKNLRATRIIYGDTQKQLAEKIGIDVKTLFNKEIGKSDFTIEEAKKISKIYGKTIEELFL